MTTEDPAVLAQALADTFTRDQLRVLILGNPVLGDAADRTGAWQILAEALNYAWGRQQAGVDR